MSPTQRKPTAADLRRQAFEASERVKLWPKWMREAASMPRKSK